MNRFAELLDRLAYEPGRNNKLRLMTDYFRSTPDPERGYALAALTGALSFQHAKPGMIRASDRRAHRSGAVRTVATIMSAILGDRRADVAGSREARPNVDPVASPMSSTTLAHARQGRLAGAARALARRAR